MSSWRWNYIKQESVRGMVPKGNDNRKSILEHTNEGRMMNREYWSRGKQPKGQVVKARQNQDVEPWNRYNCRGSAG